MCYDMKHLLLLGLVAVVQAASIRECSGHGCTDDRQVLQMVIPMPNDTVKLNLRRSEVVNSSIPIYLGTDRYAYSRWRSDKKQEDFVVYEDPEREASFVMWTEEKEGERGTGMRGVFRNGDTMFQLAPLPSRQSFRDPLPTNSDTVVVNVNNLDMVMTSLEADFATETEQRVSEENDAMQQEIKRYMTGVKEQGQAFPKYYYEVELFLVLDYAVFDQWVRRSPYTHYRDREADAVDNIRFFYAHVMHGFNQVYRSVENHDMRITVRPVGIYIAKTRAASYFTEGYGIRSGDFIEADRALDAFEEWINTDSLKLPPFDQASLFTGNQMYAGYYNNGQRRRINGLADIQGVCGYRRASITRDRGIHPSINTGAHELGHNLGAYHDGYDNNCLSRDQYIMAVTPGNVDENNEDNLGEFSYCSKNYFREYLLLLSSKNQNCLLSRDNNEQWYYDQLLATEPGERYSVDEQCKMIYGSQSFYCGGGHHDETLCGYMTCWDPINRACLGTAEQVAGDRTQCGDRKWCVDGECVYDSRAPHADNPECVYGDYKDPIAERRKCYDLGINEPYRCYQDTFRQKCCDTCKKIEREDNKQCPYGDRNPDYCRTIRPFDCYHESANRSCCETCAKMLTGGPKGCEYGDKASHCRTIQKYRCYIEKDTCCQKCSQPESTTVGCEYGDMESWCSTTDVRNCRDPTTKRRCCHRCRDYTDDDDKPVTTNPSCPRPDLTWCAGYVSKYPQSCERSSIRDDCCASCSTQTQTPAECQDDAQWCGTIYSGDCYSPKTNGSCCRTCSTHFTNSVSCQYGDKNSWCADHVSKYPDSCTRRTIREDCCRSCGSQSQEPGTSASCRDNASWCNNIDPWDCYSDKTRTTCCAKCATFDRGTDYCRYGNQYSWCRNNADYCNTVEGCCDVCR